MKASVSTVGICIFSIFVSPSFQSTIENGTFCYGNDLDCGFKSEEWPGVCQTGERQSPIDLPHTEVTIKAAASNGRRFDFKVCFFAN